MVSTVGKILKCFPGCLKSLFWNHDFIEKGQKPDQNRAQTGTLQVKIGHKISIKISAGEYKLPSLPLGARLGTHFCNLVLKSCYRNASING